MSTADERTQIAVLQTQMIEVKSSLLDIKKDQHNGFESVNKKLDDMATTYATKVELADAKKELTKNKNTERFLLVILTVVVTFLASYFLNSVGNKNDPKPQAADTTHTTTNSSTTTSTPSSPAKAKAEAKATSDGKTNSVTDEVLDNLPKVTP